MQFFLMRDDEPEQAYDPELNDAEIREINAMYALYLNELDYDLSSRDLANWMSLTHKRTFQCLAWPGEGGESVIYDGKVYGVDEIQDLEILEFIQDHQAWFLYEFEAYEMIEIFNDYDNSREL